MALRRWKRATHSDSVLEDRLKAWRNDVEANGLLALEPWAILNDEDDFVGRIPDTTVIVSGCLLPYEQLVVVLNFES